MFLDALDECRDDEEEDLLDFIRYLSSHNQVKVCVSSRPEQIFRHRFSSSPQIRLQDLNLPDLERTTEELLQPVLNEFFSDQLYETRRLMESTIEKSQGIFLWLDLIIKRIVRGARNADTLDELRSLLDDTPNTIYGMYDQMLAKMDKAYRQEAFRYFKYIMQSQSNESWFPLTLLDIVYINDESALYVSKRKTPSTETAEFLYHYQKSETRMLTRCAGFVEIAQQEVFLDNMREASSPDLITLPQGEK